MPTVIRSRRTRRPTLDVVSRRAGTTALAVVAGLLIAAPIAQAAAPTLPTGEAHGVRIERQRGAITVVFSKRATPLYRRIAGKRVDVECSTEPHSNTLGVAPGRHSGGVIFRAPKERRPLRAGSMERGSDYCQVRLSRRHDDQRRASDLIVSIPLTQTGAVYLDEQASAFRLFSLLLFAGELGDKQTPSAYLTPQQFLETLRTLGRRPVRGIVALASPSDTPPAGDLGYYSDGQRHAAVVTLSATGRRLFIEVAAGDDIHTNLSQFIFATDL